MRVLITGVAGFLGRAIASYAGKLGHSIAGVDRVALDAPAAGRLELFVQETLSGSLVDDVVRRFKPDVCVHCAGRASVPESMGDPVGDFQAAATPTILMLDALRREAPRCRFVLASSAAVYGSPEILPISEEQLLRPLSPYGFHKLACEQLCREFTQVYGLSTASVRIFSAYGEGLRRQVVFDIFEKATRERPLTLRGVRSASRDFIHAQDVAAGVLLVGARGRLDGECYNLASGVETCIGELAERICDLVGFSGGVAFDGIVPEGTPLRWQADLSRIRSLGFVPRVELAEGLRSYAEWHSKESNGRLRRG